MTDKIDRYSNVTTHMEGTKLIIEVETDANKVDIQPSASAKSMVIATTGGAKPIQGLPQKVRLNLTLYSKL